MPRTWQQNTQKYLPWLETVTVTSVRPNSTDQEGECEAGVYKLTGVEGAPSYGVYTKHTVRFTLSYADLPFDPKPRDRITWKGDAYTVLSATGSDWQQFWVADAVNLVLAEDLRQTCQIKRPPDTKDAGGRLALASYTTIYSAVPCRLQPLESTRTESLGRTTAPRRFAAYLGVEVWPLLSRDVLVVGDDAYTIDAVRSPERIDQLPELECTRID